MKEELEQDLPDTGRKRMVLLGVGIVSALSFLSFGFFKKKKDVIACAPPPAAGKTVKMLTQDGILVEVDIAHLNTEKQQITNTELQEWIKR